MKRIFSILILFSIPFLSFSQKPVALTDSFTVFGQVAKPLTVTFADLQKEEQVRVDSLRILNYKGERKSVYENIKGVRLLDVVKKVTVRSPDAKTLSEFYLIAKAADGYSVVISWNELFNSEMGNSFILVTEANNKPQRDAPERILLIAAKDLMTGRRHVKGLASIEIKRI